MQHQFKSTSWPYCMPCPVSLTSPLLLDYRELLFFPPLRYCTDFHAVPETAKTDRRQERNLYFNEAFVADDSMQKELWLPQTVENMQQLLVKLVLPKMSEVKKKSLYNVWISVFSFEHSETSKRIFSLVLSASNSRSLNKHCRLIFTCPLWMWEKCNRAPCSYLPSSYCSYPERL